MQYHIESYVEVQAGLAEVFLFFSDARNLGVLTPAELQFHIQTPQPISMHEGTLIDYTIRLWGMPLRWRTRIARWNPPHVFVDEQLRGPYRTWVHTHRFREIAGGTAIEDAVTYTLPFGWLGRLAAPLVRRQLRRIFEFRRARMRALLSPDLTATAVALSSTV